MLKPDLKPDWKLEKHRVNKGLGEGSSFIIFNLTSPEGLKYTFNNSSDKNPKYYINTMLIGKSLKDALQFIYRMDEEKIYISVKEFSDEPIYKVVGNNKDTFYVEELDSNALIIRDTKLMQEYAYTKIIQECSQKVPEAIVYCTKDTLPEAKQMIADIVIKGKLRVFDDEIARITRQKEELTNKIEAFLSETPASLEEDEDMER